MKTGVAWYFGCPASGKTTLARSHAIAAIRANGYPALVIDTEGVAQLRGFPRARNASDAAKMIWKLRRSCSLIPESPEDVDRLLACARKPGRVNLFIDEAHAWINSHSASSDRLIRLMRAHRHSKLRIFLTTQHLSGDIPQAALACAPELFVFRCTSRTTLKRLAELGMNPSAIASLPQFTYVRFYDGFET